MNNRKAIVLAGAANLITAFGGGAVLGKGINVISFSTIQLGSLVAFFLGTALGLFILYGALKGKGQGADVWVAALGSFSSACLFMLFLFAQSQDGRIEGIAGVLFFILLCVRFAFWFLSRVLRSDRLALYSTRAMPLIEGLFHSGTILSLALLSVGALPWKGLGSILLVDCMAQGMAGIMDFLGWSSSQTPFQPATREGYKKAPTLPQVKMSRFWMAVAIFCLATVWCQVVLFHLAHLAPDFGTEILAAFYLSIAALGLIGAKTGIEWTCVESLFSRIRLGKEPGLQVSSFAVIIVSGICVLLLLRSSAVIQSFRLVVLLTFLAGFFYELFSFGILHYISRAGEALLIDRAVARSFGFVAMAAAVAMVLLRSFEWGVGASAFFVVILFIVQAILMVLLNFRAHRRLR